MALYTPISQLPYPQGSDPPAASQVQALAIAAERIGVMKFSSASARSSALPAPTAGMLTYRSDISAFEFWDGVQWSALFGYNTLASTKSIRPQQPPSPNPYDVTTTSFQTYSTGTFSFTKQYAPSSLRLHIEHSGYIPGSAPSGTELYCAISFNGTDYQFADFMFNVVNAHQTFVGTYDVAAGTAPGTYTLQLKYRLAVAGGGRVIRMDSNDELYMSCEEVKTLS